MDWNVSPTEALAIQNKLRGMIRIEPLDVAALNTVAGGDLSFDKGSDVVFAGFVTLRLSGLEMVERAGLQARARFPYVPGLLSFRESPPLLEAWEQLRNRPDALVYDAHGFAHPRRFGIACHLGLLLDIPTVGCAKSVLVGKHGDVGPDPGDWTPLEDRGEIIGAALRTRAGVSPIYVSVGHRCDLESAIALLLRCVRNTRIPEPTRQAHLFVNELRRGGSKDDSSNGGSSYPAGKIE